MTQSRSHLEEHEPERSTDRAVASAYRLIADCFVYPEEVDRPAYVDDATSHVIPEIATHVDEEAAAFLTAFLDDFEDITPQEYVQTLELSPACPLYLGHYEFEDPKTCREIADADRNQYMVELAGIYGHFGYELDTELPDYIPAMVEFLWLTSSERDDPLREDFLSKLHSMLPGMIERFEGTGTPYQWPLKALERVIEYDMGRDPGGDA